MSSLDNSHTFWHTILYIVAMVICVCYTFLCPIFFPGTAIGDFFGRGGCSSYLYSRGTVAPTSYASGEQSVLHSASWLVIQCYNTFVIQANAVYT